MVSDSNNWRRGRDSNPRCRCRHTGFQDRRIQPLCHPSTPVFKFSLPRSPSLYRWHGPAPPSLRSTTAFLAPVFVTAPPGSLSLRSPDVGSRDAEAASMRGGIRERRFDRVCSVDSVPRPTCGGRTSMRGRFRGIRPWVSGQSPRRRRPGAGLRAF